MTGEMSVVFVNVYRLHSFSIAAFTDEFCDLLDELRDANSHIVIAGDFNCPGYDKNAIDSRLSALLSYYNLVVVNDGLTRLNYDGGASKLDLIVEFDG
jgi:endonuclease/exonuclease/phosphatase family metal-dependent hydrolase